MCLERDANLHMAYLMLLPVTVSCFSKIQIGFTFLVLAHLGSPGQRAVKRVFWWRIAVIRSLATITVATYCRYLHDDAGQVELSLVISE